VDEAAQPPGRPRVAVIIPTVGRDTVSESVTRVLADDVVTEVVVVADRDGEAVRAALGALRDDARLTIVDGPGRGASWARQRGAEATTAPVLLFLDDDVVPMVGLASAHARHHVVPDRVVVGFMPVSDECRRRSATARVYGNDYLAACAEIEREPARILGDLWAGNVSLSRASVERVPLASADADVRCREDQAFGLRCARAGLTGVFDRSLRAEHQFERSLPAFLASAREQATELEELRDLFPELANHDAGASPATGASAWLLRAATRRPLGAAIRGAARAGVRVAGVVGAAHLEEQGVALLRALVQQDAQSARDRSASGRVGTQPGQ
jgi:glycosyltransferase involved in cell wall biosynthesis